MAFLNGSNYTGARYFAAQYLSFQGSSVPPTADSPQTIIVNIVVTPVITPPQPGIGSGRVLLHTANRPGVFFIGRLPPPN